MRGKISLIVDNPIGKKQEGFGDLGLVGAIDALTVFERIISVAIGIITVVGAIWFVFLILTGAIQIMSAGGDKAQLVTGRQKIVTALIGFVVLVGAIFLADFVGYILGVNLLSPADFVRSLP